MGTINDYAFFHVKQQGYQISDQRPDSGDGDILYYGYLNKEGEWYIMKEDSSDGGADIYSWKFIKGTSAYSTNWANRETLTYALFDATFK